ncbi:MAG: hypothetical protein ACJ8NS_05630 [Chthoniobacterales bacterium]
MFSPQARALLTVMRHDIRRYGQSIVDCEKLLVFVSKSDPIGIQFGHIFAMAEREHWSVEFRNDGMIRFSTLASDATPIDVGWLPDARRAAEK